MPKKLLTSVALAGSLLALAGCGETVDPGAQDQPDDAQDLKGGEQGQPEGGPEGGEEQPEMPEPDVEDVPDVVAEVNGEEITGEEFITNYEAQFSQMAMMSGGDLDQDELKEQTLENMVGVELIVQDAQAQGLEASEEEIDSQLEETAEASGMSSSDELLEAVEEQGFPEEEIREDMETQILMEQVIDNLEVEEPTEEELEELYEEMAAQQPPLEEGPEGEEMETPPFEEMRPQLEEQAAAEKENEAVMAHIDDLREDADVEIHL